MKKRILSFALMITILCPTMLIRANAANSITEAEIMTKLSNAEAIWSDHSIYVDQLVDGCGQCFGFVRELFKYVFEAEAPTQFNKAAEFTANTMNVQKIGHLNSGYSDNQLKALLAQAKPGDVLVASQNNIMKFPNHVVIVRSAKPDGSGVYVYDANGIQDKDGNELIRTNFLWTAERIRSTKPYAVTLYRYKNYSVNAPTVTITFDPNGGVVSQTSKTVAAGSVVGNMPMPTREGYTFLGWSTNKNTSGLLLRTGDEMIVEKDCTLYAEWKSNSNTYIVTLDDGSICERITVTNGSTYDNLPTPKREGYTFAGWYTQVSGGLQITSATKVNLTGDQTLYAHWIDLNPFYAVTLDVDGTTYKQVRVSNGSYYTFLALLPTPTKDGYTFDGWYTQKAGGSVVTDSTKVNLTGDQTLYAHWAKNPVKPESTPETGPEVVPGETYTVVLDDGASLTTTTVNNGGPYVLTTPTRDGYTFDGWYTAETGGTRITSSTKVNLTADQRLYAHWQKIDSSPSGHWGPWSDWSTIHYIADETRQVETREKTEQVIITEGRTEYRYGGYVTSDGKHECWCETYCRSKFGSANLRYSDWSTTRYSAAATGWTCGQCNGSHINVGHYSADGRAWWSQYTLPSGDYFWEESRTVEPQYATNMELQYRYRDWIAD